MAKYALSDEASRDVLSLAPHNEPHYMMMAYSLAFDHNLDLAGKYGKADNRALTLLTVWIARSEALSTRSA